MLGYCVMTVSEIKFKYDNIRPHRSVSLNSNQERLDSYVE
jgi:hypothetical protein